MIAEGLLVLINIFALAKSNDCQSNFTWDSESYSVAIGEPLSDDKLSCRIRERELSYSSVRMEEGLYLDRDIEWDSSRCLDEHTIIFDALEKTPDPFRDHDDDVSFMSYLAIRCDGVSQIQFNYDGILPTTGNIVTSSYFESIHRHVTTLYIPYDLDYYAVKIVH